MQVCKSLNKHLVLESIFCILFLYLLQSGNGPLGALALQIVPKAKGKEFKLAFRWKTGTQLQTQSAMGKRCNRLRVRHALTSLLIVQVKMH